MAKFKPVYVLLFCGQQLFKNTLYSSLKRFTNTTQRETAGLGLVWGKAAESCHCTSFVLTVMNAEWKVISLSRFQNVLRLNVSKSADHKASVFPRDYGRISNIVMALMQSLIAVSLHFGKNPININGRKTQTRPLLVSVLGLGNQ